MKISEVCKDQHGAVLVIGLIFMAILSIVGTTAYLTTSNELKISSNYKTSKQAFYDAEAGTEYALSQIEGGLKSDPATFTLPASIGNFVPLTYSAPAGFSFTFSNLTKTDTNRYTFTSTGSGPGNSQAAIEVIFKRDSALTYGVFGDQKIEIKNSANIYSYNHDTTPNPTPSDSTGEADIGSNGHLEIKNSAFIDGDMALGDDGAGTEATIEIKTGVTITGDTGVDVDRVDPDPLGVVGGEYAAKFTTYSTSNDNGLASPAISGTKINLKTGESMTLYGKSGGANYYLTNIKLKNGSTIDIDTSAGPVNIFLAGKLEAKTGSTINVTGAPSDFSVFSNSTDNVEFKHGSTFKGLIYAPYAKVEMKNSANVYGAIWGKDVEIKASANIYFDTSLKDKIQSNNLTLVAWRDVRS